MIPWDTFKTPQDAYEHTQARLREGFAKMPQWEIDLFVQGRAFAWQMTPKGFATWWASNNEPGKPQEGVYLPVRR